MHVPSGVRPCAPSPQHSGRQGASCIHPGIRCHAEGIWTAPSVQVLQGEKKASNFKYALMKNKVAEVFLSEFRTFWVNKSFM